MQPLSWTSASGQFAQGRWTHILVKSFVNRAKSPEVCTRGSQAQSPVGSTEHVVRVLITLTVVFPKTHRANLEGCFFGERAIRAAGTCFHVDLDVQRPQLSRFGPREERESKRIRRWAEVGSSAKLAPAFGANF
jgi:hypothetical protein